MRCSYSRRAVSSMTSPVEDCSLPAPASSRQCSSRPGSASSRARSAMPFELLTTSSRPAHSTTQASPCRSNRPLVGPVRCGPVVRLVGGVGSVARRLAGQAPPRPRAQRGRTRGPGSGSISGPIVVKELTSGTGRGGRDAAQASSPRWCRSTATVRKACAGRPPSSPWMNESRRSSNARGGGALVAGGRARRWPAPGGLRRRRPVRRLPAGRDHLGDRCVSATGGIDSQQDVGRGDPRPHSLIRPRSVRASASMASRTSTAPSSSSLPGREDGPEGRRLPGEGPRPTSRAAGVGLRRTLRAGPGRPACSGARPMTRFTVQR